MLQVQASVFSEPATDGGCEMIRLRDGNSKRTPPRGRAWVSDGDLSRNGGDKGGDGEDATTEHGGDCWKR